MSEVPLSELPEAEDQSRLPEAMDHAAMAEDVDPPDQPTP